MADRRLDPRWNGRQHADPFRRELWSDGMASRRAAVPAAPAPPPPPISVMTFGVEIEFLVFQRRLPRGQRANDATLIHANSGYVLIDDDGDETTVRRTLIHDLRSSGLDINDIGEDNWTLVPPPGAPEHTRHSANTRNPVYRRWILTFDSSLAIYDTEMLNHIPPLRPDGTRLVTRFVGCELVSPAFSFNTESFLELKHAVSVLSTLYKIHVNESAGLHVHVGMGPNPIGPAALMRIACVLWTIDAIMNPIHPVERHRNWYCYRNRQFANLANGMQAVNAMDGAGGSKYEERNDVTIAEGVSELRKCTTSVQVARLMTGSDPAYTFSAYLSLPSGDFIDPRKKYTIEFRQAAASLNETWIAHWAYLCTRICEWAAFEMDWTYMDTLVVRCDRVEEGLEPWQPVLRYFLEEIGCQGIAHYILSTTIQQRESPVGRTTRP